MSTGLTIKRTNGNIKPVAANNDHVSGLVMYIPDASLPAGFTTANRIQKIGDLTEAESKGITSDGKNWYIKCLWYHLRECFRVNLSIELYVGLFTPIASGKTWDFAEIKQVITYAGGDIRQVGVYAPDKEYAKADVSALQSIATVEEDDDMPFSIVYCPYVKDVLAMDTNIADGNRNVSICVGQDLEEDSFASQLQSEKTATSVGMVGIAIGILSKAKVNECIAWVKKFPTGVGVAGLSDGKLMKNLNKTQRETLETKRLIFLKTYTGYSGVFFNDSYTMDLATSDYNSIERMRTMDKACRGVRTYLLPYVGGNVKLDADTGRIGEDTIALLKNEGNRYLEQMERDEELSGYRVNIDSRQNVLATSKIEIVIQKVPMGVSRILSIKMGYAEKLED